MNKQQGFTLIELMIVVAIVGIVGVFGTTVYVISHFLAKFW